MGQATASTNNNDNIEWLVHRYMHAGARAGPLFDIGFHGLLSFAIKQPAALREAYDGYVWTNVTQNNLLWAVHEPSQAPTSRVESGWVRVARPDPKLVRVSKPPDSTRPDRTGDLTREIYIFFLILTRPAGRIVTVEDR